MSISSCLPSLSNSSDSVVKIDMLTAPSNMLSCRYDYLFGVDVLPLYNHIFTTYLPLPNPYSSLAKNICNQWMEIHYMVQHKPKGAR